MVTRAAFERTQSMHASGASADEIARSLGISRSTVYKINQGTYRPPPESSRCATCGGQQWNDTCKLCQTKRRKSVIRFAATEIQGHVPAQERKKLETGLVDVLPFRIANYLDAAGIRTVHDVLMRTCRELIAVPGIGLDSFKQVLRALDGLDFDTRRAWQFYNRAAARKAGRRTETNSTSSHTARMTAA